MQAWNGMAGETISPAIFALAATICDHELIARYNNVA
jgi:hypothetical protein